MVQLDNADYVKCHKCGAINLRRKIYYRILKPKNPVRMQHELHSYVAAYVCGSCQAPIPDSEITGNTRVFGLLNPDVE